MTATLGILCTACLGFAAGASVMGVLLWRIWVGYLLSQSEPDHRRGV